MKKTMLMLTTAAIFFAACSKKDGTNLSSNQPQAPVISNTTFQPLFMTLPTIPAGTYNITSYGASTSSSDNATAVQAAINAASLAGGGTVVVPSGSYNCGPISLKSNIDLQLSAGSVLKVIPYGSYPGSGGTARLINFIDLNGLTNVLISGSGQIDGQGSAWWSAFLATKGTASAIARPTMIGIDNSSTIKITGISIVNAPNVHIVVHTNDNSVTIDGVTLNSPSTAPNTDGIDTWSTNINITNCNISCGDDNIAMDSNSSYVTVTNCTFGTGHGLSIGSYTANVDHITVDNCTFNGTTNGIHIKSSRTRSGIVQYLTYSNITMTNVGYPVDLIEYYPDSTIPSSPTADPAQAITSTTPVWKHITFKNITATGATKAGYLWSVPEKPMADLTFDNVHISATTGMTANYVNGAAFINGSRITVVSGNAFINPYSATITGINLTTGAPL